MADLRDALDNAIRLGNVGGLTRKGCVTAVLPVVERYLATSRAEVEQLRQVVDSVRYLHRVHRCDGPPEDCPCADDRAEAGGDVCAHCTRAWPCTTAAYVRAVDGGGRS